MALNQKSNIGQMARHGRGHCRRPAVALNIGGTIVWIGFVFFAVSAAAWVVAGWHMGEPSLVAMHGVFLAINLLGIWR